MVGPETNSGMFFVDIVPKMNILLLKNIPLRVWKEEKRLLFNTKAAWWMADKCIAPTAEEQKHQPRLKTDGEQRSILSAGLESCKRRVEALLTQKMMLNPKMKYLMQQLTS